MQSSDLTRALLGTLADAYPTSMKLSALADEIRCEPQALHKHLRLLHELGAIHASGWESSVGCASITDAGLAFMQRDLHAFAARPLRMNPH